MVRCCIFKFSSGFTAHASAFHFGLRQFRGNSPTPITRSPKFQVNQPSLFAVRFRGMKATRTYARFPFCKFSKSLLSLETPKTSKMSHVRQLDRRVPMKAVRTTGTAVLQRTSPILKFTLLPVRKSHNSASSTCPSDIAARSSTCEIEITWQSFWRSSLAPEKPLQ